MGCIALKRKQNGSFPTAPVDLFADGTIANQRSMLVRPCIPVPPQDLPSASPHRR
jgi:hypothetical protein